MILLNKRFWISTILGVLVVITYSVVIGNIFMPIKPATLNGRVLGMGLLVLMTLGMNLFFWVFIRWNGCLGRTGIIRLTLLFAFLIQVPSNLGFVIWFDLPLKAVLAIVMQGSSEVIVIGLIASLFLRSSVCALSPKKDS